MKLIDGNETIVVVTGSSGAATERDLPLALELKAEIDRRGGGLAFRRAVVIRDVRYVDTPAFHGHPTIAIGGPGANDVSHHLSQVLPTLAARGDRSFVQMTSEGSGRQVTLWGMDAGATRAAVELFVNEGYLDTLLGRVWPFRADLIC